MAGHLGQLVRAVVDIDGLRQLQAEYGNTLQQLPELCAAVIIKASQVRQGRGSMWRSCCASLQV
jgi:hypothetical protein